MDTVIGTRMLFSGECVDTAANMDIISGERKITRLREAFGEGSVDWRASRSYADSYSDIALMRMVGQPVAVNPDPGSKKCCTAGRLAYDRFAGECAIEDRKTW